MSPFLLVTKLDARTLGTLEVMEGNVVASWLPRGWVMECPRAQYACPPNQDGARLALDGNGVWEYRAGNGGYGAFGREKRRQVLGRPAERSDGREEQRRGWELLPP